MPQRIFERRRRSVGAWANQNAFAAGQQGGGGALRDLILADPNIYAYYEYEVIDGAQPPYFIPDSAPNAYNWNYNIDPAPDPPYTAVQVLGQVGLGLEMGSAGASIARMGCDLPSVADVDLFAANDAFTLETWLQKTSTAPTGFYVNRVGGDAVDLGEQTPLAFFAVTDFVSDLDIGLDVNVAAGFESQFLYNTAPDGINDLLYHHYCVTYEFGVGSFLYHNGIAVASGAASLPLAVTGITVPRIEFQCGTIHFDETAFYNRALSASDVLDHYLAGAP